MMQVQVKSLDVKMSASNTLTSTSNSIPKASLLAAKSGFVIPKNKLSGSLIPIFKGKKLGANSSSIEESNKLGHRKTKWGPDPAQDSDIKRRRALAYQIRVDQIALMVKSRVLGSKGSQNLQVADQMDSKKLELLELERREAIGEIMKLNPRYKVPQDYIPLLKEAEIPIPVKDYPGHDFVRLILGTGNETQRRLEKETGAKVQLFGMKADMTDKVEVSPTDENFSQVSHQLLVVRVTADEFDKVDAAVALMELLITSISGNLTAAAAAAVEKNANLIGQNQEAAGTPVGPVDVKQGAVRHEPWPTQASMQEQFQYQGPGLVPPQIASAPLCNSSSTMPSSMVASPVGSCGFNSFPQGPPLLPPRPHNPSSLVNAPLAQPRLMAPPPIFTPLRPLPMVPPPPSFSPLVAPCRPPNPSPHAHVGSYFRPNPPPIGPTLSFTPVDPHHHGGPGLHHHHRPPQFSPVQTFGGQQLAGPAVRPPASQEMPFPRPPATSDLMGGIPFAMQSRSMCLQTRMTSFGPSSQRSNQTAPFPVPPPARAGMFEPLQNLPSPFVGPQGSFFGPSCRPPSSSSGQQNYDPFSPTSGPATVQPQNSATDRSQHGYGG